MTESKNFVAGKTHGSLERLVCGLVTWLEYVCGVGRQFHNDNILLMAYIEPLWAVSRAMPVN